VSTAATELRPGTCMKCGLRLVRTVHGGNVHEDGQVRCPKTPPACPLCDRDPMYQCRAIGCNVLAHPTCLIGCRCCGFLFCPDHVQGFMCDACRADAGEPVEEQGWPALAPEYTPMEGSP
jgi:hypothetical protein